MDKDKYCGVCDEELWPQIIQCMYCERYFHWECVGVDWTIEEEEEWWLCDKCNSWIYAKQETNSDSENSDEFEDTSSDRSENTTSSQTSGSSKDDSSSDQNGSTKSYSSSESSETENHENGQRCNRLTIDSSPSPNQIQGQNRKDVQQETVVPAKNILVGNQQVSTPTAELVNVKQDIKPIQSIEARDGPARNQQVSSRSNQSEGASSKSNRCSSARDQSKIEISLVKDLKANNNKATMIKLQKPFKRRSRHQGQIRIINQTKPILSNKSRRIKKENTFKVDESRDVHKDMEYQFNDTSSNDQWEPENRSIQRSTYGNPTKLETQCTLEHQFDKTSFENNQFKRGGAEEQVNRRATIALSQPTTTSDITPCHLRDEKQRMINQKATLEIKRPRGSRQKFDYSIANDYKPIDRELPIQSTWDQWQSLESKKVENQRQGREFGKFEDQLPRYEVTVYTIYDQNMGFIVGQDCIIEQQGHRKPYRSRVYQENTQCGLETLNQSYQSLEVQLQIDVNIILRNRDDLAKILNENQKSIGSPEQVNGISSIEQIDHRQRKHGKLIFVAKYVLRGWHILIKLVMNWINMGWSTFAMWMYRKDIVIRKSFMDTEKVKYPKVSSFKAKNIWRAGLQDSVKLKENIPTAPNSSRLSNLLWNQLTKRLKKIMPFEKDITESIVCKNKPIIQLHARVFMIQIRSNNQVCRAKVEIISGTVTNSKGRIIKVTKSGLWRSAHKLALLKVASKSGLAQSNRKTGGSVAATKFKSNVGACVTIPTESIPTNDPTLPACQGTNVKGEKEKDVKDVVMLSSQI